MKLRHSEWAWEDAEKSNQMLQREMESFFNHGKLDCWGKRCQSAEVKEWAVPLAARLPSPASAAGPGPQWGCRTSTGWRQQSRHPIRSPSPTGAGAAQDLEAAPTVQGVVGIRADSPVAARIDGTWDTSSPPGTLCILY